MEKSLDHIKEEAISQFVKMRERLEETIILIDAVDTPKEFLDVMIDNPMTKFILDEKRKGMDR